MQVKYILESISRSFIVKVFSSTFKTMHMNMAQYLLIRQYFRPWIVSAWSSRKVSLLVQHGWVGRCPTEQQSPVLLLNVRFPCSRDPSAMDAAALRSVHFKGWSPAQCDLSPNTFNVLLEVHLPSFCPSLPACRSFSRLICNKDNKFKTEEERWIFFITSSQPGL